MKALGSQKFVMTNHKMEEHICKSYYLVSITEDNKRLLLLNNKTNNPDDI
jgi:hypothetical protein